MRSNLYKRKNGVKANDKHFWIHRKALYVLCCYRLQDFVRSLIIIIFFFFLDSFIVLLRCGRFQIKSVNLLLETLGKSNFLKKEKKKLRRNAY